jgi:hypothetical protein
MASKKLCKEQSVFLKLTTLRYLKEDFGSFELPRAHCSTHENSSTQSQGHALSDAAVVTALMFVFLAIGFIWLGLVSRSCEHSNGYLRSIKGGKFFIGSTF